MSITIENGIITILYKKGNSPIKAVIAKDINSTDCYFNIGCYTQSKIINSGTVKSSISLFGVEITHSADYIPVLTSKPSASSQGSVAAPEVTPPETIPTHIYPKRDRRKKNNQ